MEIQTIFVYIASLVFAVVAYIIPKRIKTYELYATGLFTTVLGLVVDLLLAMKYKLYVLDKPGVQIPPLIGQVVLYFTGCVILLNFYPYQKTIKWKIAYVLFCSFLVTIFEYLCFRFQFMNYYEWSIWYSALCYPFIICLFLIHHKIFQRLVSQSMNNEE